MENFWFQIASIVGGVLSTSVILTWWISGQFSRNRESFFTRMDILFDKILQKLEYHEKHDDQRFAEIRDLSNQRFAEIKDEIWQIRLRNASKDGYLPTVRPHFDQEEKRPRGAQAREKEASGS